MSRIPYRRILVVSMLLALTVVPMAGARTVKSPAVQAHGGDWLGAALRWVEDIAGLWPSGHRPNVPGTKDLEITTGGLRPSGGSCIDPGGHPNPLCGGV
jgi:hypothetical protein